MKPSQVLALLDKEQSQNITLVATEPTYHGLEHQILIDTSVTADKIVLLIADLILQTGRIYHIPPEIILAALGELCEKFPERQNEGEMKEFIKGRDI